MSANYSIPIFFSETGCNVARPRTFEDQGAIFGPQTLGTWSGSIVYEWVQETNDYGLVSYPNGGVTGAPSPIQPDFGNLQRQWTGLKPSGVAEAAYTPSFAPPACPRASGGWLVDGEVAVPTLGMAVVRSVAAGVRVSVQTSVEAATTTYVLSAGDGSGSNGSQSSVTAAATTTSGGSSKSANGRAALGAAYLGGEFVVLSIVVVLLQ
jgi:hypothetical protein